MRWKIVIQKNIQDFLLLKLWSLNPVVHKNKKMTWLFCFSSCGFKRLWVFMLNTKGDISKNAGFWNSSTSVLEKQLLWKSKGPIN